ncbi:unnamed protein product, partial [Callosobruchus maculatus]
RPNESLTLLHSQVLVRSGCHVQHDITLLSSVNIYLLKRTFIFWMQLWCG